MGFLSIQSIIPPGTVLPYAGTVIPTGWLLCDGSEKSRSTYASLYAALGGASSPYGQGNGSTTFNLPDARGRTVAGKDTAVSSVYADRLTSTTINSRTLGASGGTEAHTLTSAQMPAHDHGGGSHSHRQRASGGVGSFIGYTHVGGQALGYTGPGGIDWYTEAPSSTVIASNGSGSPHPITQPTIIFNYIIKI